MAASWTGSTPCCPAPRSATCCSPPSSDNAVPCRAVPARPRPVSAAPRPWDTGSAMTSLPLVFDAPRRALPPRHLADLDASERRVAVTELGEPAFRADQLSRQYFGRLENRPAAMTDLPAAARDRLGAALLPELLTEVRHVETDRGATRKTLW